MSTPPVGSPVRLIMVGAGGRIGARLCALAQSDPALALVGAVERGAGESGGATGTRGAAGAGGVKITESTAVFGPSSADVVIDFSSDEGARAALELARRIGAALLVGTTALSARTRGALHEASRDCAILISPNTSLGVAALSALAAQAAKILGAGFDCSIVEAHHSAKKDAPSGTAIRLAEAARRGGASLPDHQIVSIRGGDVVGEHTVRFAGPGEYIELTHRATSRDLFVRGALHAAAWLKGRGPGLWTMEDVLGLPAR
jgi:4-hydroxy-tetrahydrodipicolinate reductase